MAYQHQCYEFSVPLSMIEIHLLHQHKIYVKQGRDLGDDIFLQNKETLEQQENLNIRDLMILQTNSNKCGDVGKSQFPLCNVIDTNYVSLKSNQTIPEKEYLKVCENCNANLQKCSLDFESYLINIRHTWDGIRVQQNDSGQIRVGTMIFLAVSCLTISSRSKKKQLTQSQPLHVILTFVKLLFSIILLFLHTSFSCCL